IRGRASQSLGPSQISKWQVLNQVIREKKIGILCVQETHLTTEHEKMINETYGRSILMFNSQDPDRPGASAGVAFIINRSMLPTDNIKITTIIPGRAILLKIKWNTCSELTILNIYAPNNPYHHKQFWESITNHWTRNNLAKPSMMLGDFNITEEPIDRAPTHRDNPDAIEALRNARQLLEVEDKWRQLEPNTRSFTYRSANNSLSRLDRIYLSEDCSPCTSNWESEPSKIPTDHNMIKIRYAPLKSPYVGKGRWTWPLYLTSNDNILNEIRNEGIKTQQQIKEQTNTRSEESNPQKTWETFKITISQIAKKEAKKQSPKIDRRIMKLKK
ncbi:DNase I-like protein, partial [Leucogyrophana mollusca]